jgi:DNA-binding transcriptional MerR regulator
MKIGELAARTDCQVETIRFHEAEGLMQPAERAANNYRACGEERVSRLGFILRCRSLDMALDEIRVLLRLLDTPELDCGILNELGAVASTPGRQPRFGSADATRVQRTHGRKVRHR